MRHLMGVSILALSLALSTSAHAEEWFRLRMGAPILFGEGTDGAPDMGGNNPIEIVAEARSDARVYGTISIAVMATGIDWAYTVDVSDRPPGATWDGNTIQWASAVEGTYTPTIEVRDGNGVLVASQDLELIVHGPLTASTPQTSYEVEVGGALTITPTAANAIGNLQWGSTPAELPEWLGFDASTGAINVDTSTANSLGEIVLTAVDQGDLASASTLPLSIAVNGLEWIATLGGGGSEFGNSIAIGSDGSIYVSGHTASAGAGSNDVFLAKYSASGALQWQRTLGGSGNDISNSLAVGTDGSIYLGGYTNSAGAGSSDAFLAGFSASGTLLWQRTLGGISGDTGQSIAIGSDGAIYVGGYAAVAGGSDALLAKFSASGTLLWQRTLGGSTGESAQSIAVGSDGSVYVGGYTSSAGAGGTDTLLAKFNASGTLLWQRTLGGSSSEYGYSVALGSDNSVYIASRSASAGAGGTDALLAKFNASGALLWQRTLGGSGSDQGNSVVVDSGGSVYLGGYTSNAGAGGNDALLAKYDASGALLWQRTLGGTGSEQFSSVAVGAEGSIYVGGYTASSGAGGNDVFVARLPTDGGDEKVSGSFTYQSSNLTSQTSTLAGEASNLSTGTPDFSTSTSTLSEGTPSLTSTTTKFARP